jgi:hypothetical protein
MPAIFNFHRIRTHARYVLVSVFAALFINERYNLGTN